MKAARPLRTLRKIFMRIVYLVLSIIVRDSLMLVAFPLSNYADSMTAKKQYVWDDRAPAYLKSGDLAVAIARQHHSIDIDTTTHQRWRQLMGLMREIDTWADDTDVSPEEVCAGLEAFDDFKELYPELSPEKLGLDAQHALLQRTAKILQLGTYIAETNSVERFVALRIAEARESVNLFEDTATQHVIEQPQFSSEFMPTLRSLGEAATLWDSLIDGRYDTRVGKQLLTPSSEYYVKITTAMLQRTKLGGAALLHAGPLLQVGIKGGLRVLNRIDHGVPEYSTIHNISRFFRYPHNK